MATTVCCTMIILLCFVLIVQSSYSDEPKQCDGCTRLSCESALIERLVRLEIENERLNERLVLVEKDKPTNVNVKYRISGDKPVKDRHRLMFDLPVFDNGNAYDAEKGEFVAPVTGLYSIVTTICLDPKDYVHVGVMKNGVLIGRFLTGDENYHACNSESTLVTLAHSDRIWVQKIHGLATTLSEDYGWNSFSVSLIRQHT